jgi:PPOX class probable F420-dependent enzyme
MAVSPDDLAFVEQHRAAAMVTIGVDGRAKVARVGVAVVDGKLWSSGTEDRVRTRRLRRDPNCTLYVYDDGFSWVALEATMRILDGDDAPEQNLRLFRTMQDRPKGPLSWFGGELEEAEFLATMRDEQRLIYEFEVTRTYGMH